MQLRAGADSGSNRIAGGDSREIFFKINSFCKVKSWQSQTQDQVCFAWLYHEVYYLQKKCSEKRETRRRAASVECPLKHRAQHNLALKLKALVSLSAMK